MRMQYLAPAGGHQFSKCRAGVGPRVASRGARRRRPISFGGAVVYTGAGAKRLQTRYQMEDMKALR